MKKIMNILKSWNPSKNIISIKANTLKSNNDFKSDKVGIFFTGGVDSFYSTLINESSNNINIDYLISVLGFDKATQNCHRLQKVNKKLLNIARTLKKEPIIITTNLKEKRFKKLTWTTYYGFALAAAALLLENLYPKILIAANVTPEDYRSSLWGDDPNVVPLYSSSKTTFILDSYDVSRFKKIDYISKSNIALNNLIVCNRSLLNYNCSKCEKCYRTMVSLYLIGKLNYCSAFNLNNFTIKNISKIYFKKDSTMSFWKELLEYSEKIKCKNLVKLINKSFRNTRIIKPCISFINRFKRVKFLSKLAYFLEYLIMKNVIK